MANFYMTHAFRKILVTALSLFSVLTLHAQQGFFLNSWAPKSITVPDYSEMAPVTNPPNVSVTIHAADTLTRVPLYMFGDNANTYTTSMSENKTLMAYLADRKMGVLRGPSGSISDVYFWNNSEHQPPTDVPETLKTGGDNPGWEWYGIRPNSWDAGWTMGIDSFYRILAQVNVTGMLTVNYGYARYGTSPDPVAQAAHMAAEWVRYDNGRTKFWEIGNEVFGNWEAGYRIDTNLNQDGQPEYITGTLYGKHCRVFVDSMKAAAAGMGVEIWIGAVAVEGAGTGPANWNVDMMKEAGDVIDYYIIHSYYTPWDQNSKADVILNAPSQTQGYIDYLNACSGLAGKQMKPVALTEYNTFATGSKQNVSQIGGMFAVLVTGEAIKSRIGAALRWDLANGYSNGDDHGMYSYGDEPGVTRFAPRPAFYYLYYMQKYLGDVLMNTTSKGTSDIKTYASAFGSGHIGVVLANKGTKAQTVRVNVEKATVGSRYYVYTLVGGSDVPADPLMPFSRKVYVNGEGPAGVAGGPLNYKTLKAKSAVIGKEILVDMPAFSVAYVLADTGNTMLSVNDTLYPSVTWNTPADIVYGTKLSSTQLNATASMSGSFSYTPVSGTKLNAGSGIALSVTFTPADVNFSPVTKKVFINVSRVTPVITWNAPADGPEGTALGEEQLNATANIDGTFEYNPAAGTILQTGEGQTLSVLFIPSDTVNYNRTNASVQINVFSITGINDAGKETITIYPVPVNDKLILSGLASLKRRAEITIVSTDGTIVFSETVEPSLNEIQVGTGHLASGNYVLNISSGDNRIVKKFTKK